MRRAVEGSLHNFPADCPSSYLHIYSRQYFKMGTIPSGERRLQCGTKQPQHECKEIHATYPLLTTNSVMAEHDPEPVVSNFNPRTYFQERFVLKLSSHFLCLYGGLSTRIQHFLLPGVTEWPTDYNLFFLLPEQSAASTSDDNTAKVCPVFMAKSKMSQCLGFRPQVCLGGEGSAPYALNSGNTFEWLVCALSLLGRVVSRNAISRNFVAGLSATT